MLKSLVRVLSLWVFSVATVNATYVYESGQSLIDLTNETGTTSLAVGDDVTNENIQEKVASVTDGNWKILTTDVGFGFWWDGSKFISPQPHASWSLNSEGTAWEAPIAQPANSTFTVSHVDDNGESYDTT